MKEVDNLLKNQKNEINCGSDDSNPIDKNIKSNEKT